MDKNKDILIQGYWIEFIKKVSAIEKINNCNAKGLKEKFLEGLDKIIELEELNKE